jgi:xylulokinase
LWNNVDSAEDAERLNGLADFAAETGSRLVPSFTITKLAHLARTDREGLATTAQVALPHDWLTFKLTGRLVTDRGDASGSGWWSATQERTRRDLLSLAVGEETANRLGLPEVLGPTELAGSLTPDAAREFGLTAGIPVGPGSGDNMARALGIGAEPGELVISLGTSGVAFTLSQNAVADPTGEVAGFADATGHYLPLVCMLNCTRVVDAVAGLFDLTTQEALDRAANEPVGADGLLLMPYFSGERTPNLPYATGAIQGITGHNLRPGLICRAAVDGVAAGFAFALDALKRVGFSPSRVELVGGGSAHETWQRAVADVLGMEVTVRTPAEYVARGAAIQIAAILRQEPVGELARRWRLPAHTTVTPRSDVWPFFRLEERRAMIETAQEAKRTSHS